MCHLGRLWWKKSGSAGGGGGRLRRAWGWVGCLSQRRRGKRLACSDTKASGLRMPRCFCWRGWFFLCFNFLPCVMPKTGMKGRGGDSQGIWVPPDLGVCELSGLHPPGWARGSLLCPPPALWLVWSRKHHRSVVCFLSAPGPSQFIFRCT